MVVRGAVADAGDDLGRHARYAWASPHDPRAGGRLRVAVARVCAAARRARRSRSFRLSVLREPTVAAMVIAGFFSIGVDDRRCRSSCRSISSWCSGMSPSGSGIALIVFLAAATAGSFIAGRLMARMTHYKRVPIGGMLLGHPDAGRRSR